MSENTETINLSEWYTAGLAAARLSANSGKKIATDYPRKLAQYGKIRSFKIGDRGSLYWKADIDGYVVEERGEKSGRAKKAAHKK